MNSETISALVISALKSAMGSDDVGKTKGQVNRNRSKNFVEELGKQFSSEYQSNKNIRVLTKHNGENRAEFGLNELLFDVLVCEVSIVPSSTRRKALTHVTKGLWAVESEMAQNSREAMYDFNKLVLSSCERLLFVGPLVSDNAAFISPLKQAAQYCKKPVYIALIPHPREWLDDENTLSRSIQVLHLNE